MKTENRGQNLEKPVWANINQLVCAFSWKEYWESKAIYAALWDVDVELLLIVKTPVRTGGQRAESVLKPSI